MEPYNYSGWWQGTFDTGDYETQVSCNLNCILECGAGWTGECKGYPSNGDWCTDECIDDCYVATGCPGGACQCSAPANSPPSVVSFNVDIEGNNLWDLDNNDIRIDFTVSDADSDPLTMYMTYKFGGSPTNPSASNYDWTYYTGTTYTRNNLDANWRTDGRSDNHASGTSASNWADTTSDIYIKIIAYDGTVYSSANEDTSNRPTGIDGTNPTTPTNAACHADDYSGNEEWDDDTTIFFTWTAATDATSGIATHYAEINDTTPDENAGNDGQDTDTGDENQLNNYYVRAKDNAGNWGSTDNDTITIDTSPPNTTIMDYLNGSSGPNMIWGNATDSSPGLLDGVKLYIKNTTSGDKYWNGTAWSSLTWLEASANDSSFDETFENWYYNSSNVTWDYNNYEIAAKAYDKAGNEDPTPAVNTFTIIQSKIVNTGNHDISAYVLISIEFYNATSSEWILDHDVLFTYVTINKDEELGLDTLFNGLVNTSYLSFGSGTYRVNVSLMDPYFNILVCGDNELVATYEFEVQY
jgi:hypothetical protein